MEKDKRIVCWTMSAAAIIAVILSVFLFYQPFDRKCQLTAVNISAPVGQTIGSRNLSIITPSKRAKRTRQWEKKCAGFFPNKAMIYKNRKNHFFGKGCTVMMQVLFS